MFRLIERPPAFLRRFIRSEGPATAFGALLSEAVLSSTDALLLSAALRLSISILSLITLSSISILSSIALSVITRCSIALPAIALSSIAISTASAAMPASGSFSLPPDSPCYEDLDHFRALGLWNGTLEMRPLSGEDFTRAVEEIRGAAAARSLAEPDLVRLNRLIEAAGRNDSKAASEADRGTAAEVPSSSGAWSRPPARWELSAGLQFFGVLTDLDSLADLDRRSRRDAAFQVGLRSALGPHIQVESRFFEDYSRLTRRPRSHWVDNLPNDLRGITTDPSARNDRAVLSASWNWIDVRLGREDRQWGVGRRGTLFLSSNPFPLDGVSLRVRTAHISATSLFAQTLRTPNPPGGAADTGAVAPRSGDAYMAAHRVEIRPPGPARIGLFEAVVFGGRGIDLAYTNPVGFFVAMTQDLFDRAQADDKKMIGADLEVALPPVRFYGEFLLNRLVTLDAASKGRDAEISSYGELAGLRWSNPLGIAGTDFDLEYAHLDPEVYFHRDNDPRRAFLTQGELIGHWAGPNSDALFAAWTAPPLGRWGALRLELEQVRWGIWNGQRGVEMGFVGMRKREKRWITGDEQRERTASLIWTRPAWKGLVPGSFDTQAQLARVERSGAWPAGGATSGWQAELRIRWNGEISWTESGLR